MDQVPPSFVTYLRRLGAQTDALTIPQLQDVFADTFMLAVMSQHPELEVPSGIVGSGAQSRLPIHTGIF